MSKALDGVATFADLWKGVRDAVRPPPKLTLSQWADKYYRLSAESAAQSGRWHTLPYQREPMDCVTDPRVTQLSFMKSKRVGFTLMVGATVGYHMHQDPCSMLAVQPTLADAQGFSKETITPMLRDIPVLAAIQVEDEAKSNRMVSKSADTILAKRFPGGALSMVGANSGAGFRRRSCRIVLFDEVDGYPASAGSDGDPIKLGMGRAEYFWNRKIIAGSTPLVEGASRIESLFEEGDQRRYFVPCPTCGHMDFLVFTRRSDGRGHHLKFTHEEKSTHPTDVHFVCAQNGCRIEHKNKRDMVAKGEWRAAKPFHGHASFHIWAAYSYSPNATWAQIAEEFLTARKGGRETMRTFTNTVLAETSKEESDAPDWEPLYQRREKYPVGTVPEGVRFLTAGVDTQKDRLVYEVVGWGAGRESWSIDSGVLLGPTAGEDVWKQLDEFLDRQYDGHNISMLAIDAAAFSQTVYAWVRRKSGARVMAVRGVAGVRALVGVPTPVDVSLAGKKIIRGGARLWPIGVDGAKSELYGWLHLPSPGANESYPPGWCHFPEYPEEFFRQLTAERLVYETKKGVKTLSWQSIQGRENHHLDTRIYARAAASRCGLERLKRGASTLPKKPSTEPETNTETAQRVAETAQKIWGHSQKLRATLEPSAQSPMTAPQPPSEKPPMQPRRSGNWLGGGKGFGGGKGWLKR